MGPGVVLGLSAPSRARVPSGFFVFTPHNNSSTAHQRPHGGAQACLSFSTSGPNVERVNGPPLELFSSHTHPKHARRAHRESFVSVA